MVMILMVVMVVRKGQTSQIRQRGQTDLALKLDRLITLLLERRKYGGRAFCHELGIGWVHIGQWIFSISTLSHELFWRKSVFCVFKL